MKTTYERFQIRKKRETRVQRTVFILKKVFYFNWSVLFKMLLDIIAGIN